MSGSSTEHEQVNRLAEEFLDRLRRGERPSLTEYTDRHPELAAQIRDLFPALIEIEQLGEAPSTTGPGLAPVDQGADEPRQLGEYRILRLVGRGGMGVVYEAIQESLGRHVALKVLPSPALLRPTQLERFRREAKAAARLHHSNIVPVFGVGEHGGVHFYAMQFIAGEPLDRVLIDVRRLRDRPDAVAEPSLAHSLTSGQFARDPDSPGVPAGPPESERHSRPSSTFSGNLSGSEYFRGVARVGAQVADALAYAHKQGILHRDVKPANVLLDARGTAWLTDFGLAKTDEGDGLTDTGDVVGTVRYLAPERFQGQADARSDVYSLGLTLYELLTLRPAFDETDRNKLIAQVMHAEPPRPRQLSPGIPRDLETIVLKAMDRDPGRRYQTATEVVEDLKRYVVGEPIRARRVSSLRRAVLWARRNPALAGLLLACSVAALALVGACVALVFNQQLQGKNVQLEEAIHRAEVEKYFRHIAEASNGLRTGNMTKVVRLLEDCPPPDLRNWEWHYLQRQCHADLLTLPGHTGAHHLNVAFSPDGRWLVAAGLEPELTLWDRTTGLQRPLHLRGREDHPPWGLAISSDSRLLAWGGPDKVLPTGQRVCTVHVWDLTTAKVVRELAIDAPIKPVSAWLSKLAFSRDGRRIAAGNMAEGTAIVWDVQSGRIVHTFRPIQKAGGGGAFAVAFSPVGQQLAVGWADGTVEVRDLGTEKATLTGAVPNAGIRDLAFCPNGERLAVACEDRTIRIWNVVTGQELPPLTGHTGWVYSVAYSPDGRHLASASADGTVRLWNATTGREVRTFRGHEREVCSVAFSPEGLHLASAGSDKKVKIWDVRLAQESLPLSRGSFTNTGLVFSPDGQRFATCKEKFVKIWDAASRQVIHTLAGHTDWVYSFSFSRDGKRLASGGLEGQLKVWDLNTFKCIWDLANEGHRNCWVTGVAFNQEGTRLVSCGTDRRLMVWDLATGRKAREDLLHLDKGFIADVAFSPDGKLLAVGAVADKDRFVTLWDTTTWQRVWRPFEGQTVGVMGVAFSPDGKRLATAGQDQTVRIWEVATGQELKKLEGHSGSVWRVAFSKDGQRLASAGYGLLRIWDTKRWEEVLVLEGQDSIHTVTFSPDGHWIATSQQNGGLHLWDGRPWDNGAATQLAAEREASGLLDSLFALPLSRKDVRDYLLTIAAIRPQSRPLALDLIERYPEETDPERYYQASWAIVRQPYLNGFQYRYALCQARTACTRASEALPVSGASTVGFMGSALGQGHFLTAAALFLANAASENGRYRTALGAVQYRTGQYQDVLTTLKNSYKGTPESLAFLAMAQSGLGLKNQAQATLEQLRQIMKKPEWAAKGEVQAVVCEAEALLRGAGRP
jgi:WD40 repeat protein/serine/threonine protein kinase